MVLFSRDSRETGSDFSRRFNMASRIRKKMVGNKEIIVADIETQDTEGQPKKKRRMVALDVAKLIELVEVRPSLYDKKHKDYKDKKKNLAIWASIGASVGVSGTLAQVRWDGLRDNYRRYKKKIKGKTGQALKRIHKYTWYDHLRWLDPHVGTRRYVSCIDHFGVVWGSLG